MNLRFSNKEKAMETTPGEAKDSNALKNINQWLGEEGIWNVLIVYGGA